MEKQIDSFIRHLATERGLSDAYQLSVRQTLDALAKWLEKRGLPLRDVGTDELSAFLSQRKNDGINAASLRIATVHLKVFFRWIAAKGGLEMDPAEPLLAPRPDQTLPETLHASEVAKLLESIDPTLRLGRRDRAILELFYAAGLRLSELCHLRLETIDLDAGFLRVTGKGNKTRVTRFGGKARESLEDYLANERPGLVTRRTSSICLPQRARRSALARPRAADRQAPRENGRHRPEHVSAPAAAFVRHPPAGRRCRPAGDPGAVRPCGHFHHPDLHPCGPAAAQVAAQALPPARMMRQPPPCGTVTWGVP